MAFQEPVGAYFAHFADEALHVASGTTIKGYLDVQQLSIQGDDLMPAVSLDAEIYWDCVLADWLAAGVRPDDILRVEDIDYRVQEPPRDRVIARVLLRRVHPYE